MNRDEIVDLLTAVAVYDNRQIGEATVTAWAAIVGTLDLDECLTAVVAHHTERPGVWLEPGHVLARVKATRQDAAMRRPQLPAPPLDPDVAARGSAAARASLGYPTSWPNTHCGYCGAQPRQPCTNTADGKARTTPHPSRSQADGVTR